MLLILSLVFVGLLLPFSSAMEITNVRTDDEMHVRTGSRLLIPCRFFVNEPIKRSTITLKWVKAIEEGKYTPIIMLTSSPSVLREEPHDMRVHLFASRLQQGNCSLVIDSVSEDDQGTYELHLDIDGLKYQQIPMVKIIVRNENDNSGIFPDHIHNLNDADDILRSLDSGQADDNLRSLDSGQADNHTEASTSRENTAYPVNETNNMTGDHIDYESPIHGETTPLVPQIHHEDGLWFDMLLDSMVKSGQIYYFAIPATIGLILVILACVGGCFLGVRWYNTCKKRKDDYKVMEEGHLVGKEKKVPSKAEETTISMDTDLSSSTLVSVPLEGIPTIINMPEPSIGPGTCLSYVIVMPEED